MIGLPVLVPSLLLLMRRRVRRRGCFGRPARASCCARCTRSCSGSAGGSPRSSSRNSRSPRCRSTTWSSPSSRLACRSGSASTSPGSRRDLSAGGQVDLGPLRLDLRRPRRRVARISRRHGSSGGHHHDRRSGTRRQLCRTQFGHRAGQGGPGPRGRIARARDAGSGPPLNELTPTTLVSRAQMVEDGRVHGLAREREEGSADGGACSAVGCSARGGGPQASPRRGFLRARLRGAGVDHRSGVALRRPLRLVPRRPQPR